MSIYDMFTPSELRDIFRKDMNEWPEDFCRFVNRELADSLLDGWLENHSDSEYLEEVREIIEIFTYGYTDDDGNELLEFDKRVDNDGQMRLF